MLKKIKLKNFRCFEDFAIEFDKFNVIVGKNNSGKSTIIDALKLISNAVRYAPHRNHLNDNDIPFSLINLRHNYNTEESLVYAQFTDSTEIEIVFPIDEHPYINLLRNGKIYNDKSSKEKILGIIPPVRTFEEEERLGDKKYIRSVMISHLTPRHFRNIWHYFPEGFEEFKELIETTWPGYSIDQSHPDYTRDRINMYFTEDRITREIFLGRSWISNMAPIDDVPGQAGPKRDIDIG